MAALFANNAEGPLSVALTSGATSVVLSSGMGTLFPSPTGGDFFMGTLFNAGGTYEIIKCTGRVADTLTIVRAQEGTAASAFLIGDKLDLRITAGALTNKLDKDTGGTVAGPLIGSAGFTGNVTGNVTGNASTATTLQTSRNIALSGDVSGTATFDGSADAAITVTLPNVNATVGAFGSGTAVPTFSCNAKGQITGVTLGNIPTAAIGTAGLVPLAAVADVLAGTSTTEAVTPAGLAGQMFESAEITVTAGASSNAIAHSLGVQPKRIEAFLRCKISEHSYAVGEELPARFLYANAAFNIQARIIPGTSYVGYVIGANGIAGLDASNGAIYNLTSSYWKLVLRAWAN